MMFALALSLIAECSLAATLPALGPGARLVAFGDSLTDGVGGAGESYPRRLAQLLGREVINEGLPGDTTADGRRRLPAVLALHRPALLILCLGVNDQLRSIPAASMRENLLAMLDSAREAQVPVLLLAVPVPGSTRPHPLFAEVAEQGGATLDTHSMIEVLSNPVLKADLVHANREGYRAIADRLALRLRPLLQE